MSGLNARNSGVALAGDLAPLGSICQRPPYHEVGECLSLSIYQGARAKPIQLFGYCWITALNQGCPNTRCLFAFRERSVLVRVAASKRMRTNAGPNGTRRIAAL